MWITKIMLRNVRCFENETIELSRGINVLVGPNNTGKSTIARAGLLIQKGYPFEPVDLRSGRNSGKIQIYLEDINKKYFEHDKLTIETNINPNGVNVAGIVNGGRSAINLIEQREPMNFIYPYLSKRKVQSYNEDVREERTLAITGNFQYLYAKIDRASNPQMPAYDFYVAACKQILGFVVTCSSSLNGKKACYAIDNFRKIDIDHMGEGVANILGLLVDLCVAEDKLFVIEEPENDIHPKALKEILRLVVKKSENNQFIITTHSNIVTRFLGAELETKIFRVDMEFKSKVPTSKSELIQNDPEARRELLRHLGYDLIDLDLWEGWLFLEESSAEKIIREYLIPWFAQSLQGRLRTFSARSIDEVESKFENFNILFSYLNLQPAYKDRAWVIVDGGEKEKKIIDKLKDIYGPSGWSEDNFKQLSEHDFERYYPEQFKEKVEGILLVTDRKERMNKKNELREEVESWIKGNIEEAKKALESSASDVISKLRAIEAKLA